MCNKNEKHLCFEINVLVNLHFHLKRSINLTKRMSLINFISRRLIHLPVYKGPHPGITETKKSSIPSTEFEEKFDRIREIQNSKVDQPSPFHLVWRSKNLHKLNGKQKVICRKLGKRQPIECIF